MYRGTVAVVAVVAVVACSKTGDSTKPVASERKADLDPNFTHVDRDQLAALCMSRLLPPSTWPSEYGAVMLDGTERAPWLTVWVNEQVGKAEDKPTVLFEAWREAANKRSEGKGDRKPLPRRTDGKDWLNVVCTGIEPMTTVVTAVFVQHDGVHLLAMRNKKIMVADLPADTPEDVVFVTAVELTRSVVGKTVAIADHKLGQETLRTVDDPRWVKAFAAATK